MRLAFGAAIAAALAMPVTAQNWVARYDGPAGNEDLARGIAADGSGCVYVTGASWGTTTGNDFATVKYGPAGETRWVARYDGAEHGSDEPGAIAASAGRVVVTGSNTGANFFTDIRTVVYDTGGTETWSASYNGPADGNDHALAVAVDPAGNVYVAGYETGDTTGWDMVTVKYNPQGVQQWVSRYVTMDEDYAVAIVADRNGCWVTGNSGSPYMLTWDYVTVRYDSGGAEQWVSRYNGPANEQDEVRAVAADGGGNVVVSGGSAGSGSGLDITTIKYGPAGDTLWLRRYNGPAGGPDQAYALAVALTGDVYVTGASLDTASDVDFATVKYSPDGTEMWVRRYDGPAHGFDEARAIAADETGVYVAGSSTGETSRADYAAVKYDHAGNQLWSQRYDGPASRLDEVVGIALAPGSGVVVTGSSAGSGTGTDYATVCYPAAGVEEMPEGEFRAAERGARVIRSTLFVPGGATQPSRFALLNPAGRKVMDLLPGANDVSRLQRGVYFIASGEEAGVVKVVLAD